jgi:hypothetical protein
MQNRLNNHKVKRNKKGFGKLPKPFFVDITQSAFTEKVACFIAGSKRYR